MSTFGNFAEMFSMFNNFTFTDQSEKTFDFKIDGEVGAIKYDLAIISNALTLILIIALYPLVKTILQ